MLIAQSLRGARRGFLQTSPRRSLSATTSFAARPRPRPAPTKPLTSVPLTKFTVEEQLPPVALLKSAKKSDALDIEPDRALSILRDYIGMVEQHKRGTWEKQFCAEKNITVRTLMLLARILLRCKERPQKFLGMTIIFSASAIGELSATLFLADHALKYEQLDHYMFAAPLDHLRILAAPPYSINEAMVLLAKVHLAQGDEGTALQLYRQAASTPPSAQGRVEANLPLHGEGVSSALVYLGEILEKKGNKSGAKDSYRKAALEHDDPTAYYHLSRMEENHPELQKKYLTKSAASGNMKAATALGQFHQRIADHSPKTSEVAATEAAFAKEWFYLSATAGDYVSMLSLAEIFVNEGKAKSALKWLDLAAGSRDESTAQKVKRLREDIENRAEK